MKNALPLSFALLLAVHSPLPAQTAVNPPPPIDVTFAFIADIHSSFNGSSDYEAIKSYSEYPALIFQEATGNNTCLDGTYVIDTCDMVQEARKLNALENNTWPSGVPTTGPIQLEGVAIGGDLTDCGAGADSPKSFHGNQCEDYDSPVNGQQLIPFLKVFDRYYGPRQSLKLDALYFLTGLTNPDGDTLRYPIFPGFGNHDLNFYDSGVMRSYIANWKPSNSNMPGISITNEDPGSESYSWDWGGLHLINAGVFVGSDDQDYNFSSDALTWIEKDLATYAADGRPVVIFQHFGLDNGKYNLWFTPSHRYFMMKAIKNYNVIGIFTGHQHEHLGSFNWPFQAWNTSWPPFPISIYPYPLSPFDSAYPYNYPLSVYDVFHPGAAFAQNLALVHVTNDRIDVTYADTTSDFDPSTGSVTFVEPFSKGLIPAPQAASPIHNAPGLSTAPPSFAPTELITWLHWEPGPTRYPESTLMVPKPLPPRASAPPLICPASSGTAQSCPPPPERFTSATART